METVIQGSTLQTLRAGLRGTAHALDRYDPHNVFRFNRNIAPSTAEH